jgi:hypothetical protein
VKGAQRVTFTAAASRKALDLRLDVENQTPGFRVPLASFHGLQAIVRLLTVGAVANLGDDMFDL